MKLTIGTMLTVTAIFLYIPQLSALPLWRLMAAAGCAGVAYALAYHGDKP